jgi:16S rRNA C967 or C1407 C5-methylase (RsmB/RsmF family)
MVLSKALNFKNQSGELPRFVSYSTCSVYEEENEKIIRDVIKKDWFKANGWKIVNLSQIIEEVIPKKYRQGIHSINHKDEGINCVRVCPDCGPKGYLNGFFLTLFERVEDAN